jgi:hypothetical protein
VQDVRAFATNQCQEALKGQGIQPLPPAKVDDADPRRRKIRKQWPAARNVSVQIRHHNVETVGL